MGGGGWWAETQERTVERKVGRKIEKEQYRKRGARMLAGNLYCPKSDARNYIYATLSQTDCASDIIQLAILMIQDKQQASKETETCTTVGHVALRTSVAQKRQARALLCLFSFFLRRRLGATSLVFSFLFIQTRVTRTGLQGDVYAV